MQIILAPDSFKGSLEANEVAHYMSEAAKNVDSEIETIVLPIADGGEGTMAALVYSTNGNFIECETMNPLGEYIVSTYGILGNEKTCVIELSSSSGLNLIKQSRENILRATSFGTGELIKKALDDGQRNFIIGLGGSATNDGGAGILQALGMKLLNPQGKEIKVGAEHLNELSDIDISNFDSRIKESNFIIAADVTNPFVGKNGATSIFSEQKGATSNEKEILENNLNHFADKIEERFNEKVHHKEGAGAGGGAGAIFHVFFPGKFKNGIDLVLEKVEFKKQVKNANLVITGEGKVDTQTSFGKAPMGVAKAAFNYNVPTIIIAGAAEGDFEPLYESGVISVNSIMNKPMQLEDAVSNAGNLLRNTTEQVLRTFLYK